MWNFVLYPHCFKPDVMLVSKQSLLLDYETLHSFAQPHHTLTNFKQNISAISLTASHTKFICKSDPTFIAPLYIIPKPAKAREGTRLVHHTHHIDIHHIHTHHIHIHYKHRKHHKDRRPPHESAVRVCIVTPQLVTAPVGALTGSFFLLPFSLPYISLLFFGVT